MTLPKSAEHLREMLDIGDPLHLHLNTMEGAPTWRLMDSYKRTRNCGTPRCFLLRLRNVQRDTARAFVGLSRRNTEAPYLTGPGVER